MLLGLPSSLLPRGGSISDRSPLPAKPDFHSGNMDYSFLSRPVHVGQFTKNRVINPRSGLGTFGRIVNHVQVRMTVKELKMMLTRLLQSPRRLQDGEIFTNAGATSDVFDMMVQDNGYTTGVYRTRRA